MAYDEALAARIRELLPDAEERKMFGGLAFLIGGNMAVAASGQGGMRVRVDPEESETTSAELMEMRGRSMKGWLRVDPAEDEVAEWVERGAAYARSLPPKR